MAKIQDVRSAMSGGSSRRQLSQITSIARHHSGSSGGDAHSFARYHTGTLGWNTSGYHEVILRNGTVQLAYDPTVITNGVGDHNSYTYHICVVGNGSFTDAQEEAFKERAKHAMSRFNVGVSSVKGHNEYANTSRFNHSSSACPGINMNTVRGWLGGSGGAPKGSGSSGSGGSSGDSSVTWLGTNDKGKRVESIYRGAEGLNFYDSARWTNPTGTFGYGEGWIVDNKYKVGNGEQFRVQNSNGDLYFITASPKYVKVVNGGGSSRGANLVVDGKWGNATTSALQSALGTTVDGVISSQPRNAVTNALYGSVTFGSNGSPMVRALQRKVGSSADGKLGPATVRALQKHLGTVQDGVLSRPSLVVEEMQRKLNSGTF